ncbi:MAG: ASKHA domain-containing protein [Dehalococcoidia bacterium]|nr:ASKHA domain-containing protein [Dehalococcoidia bacterium]
MKAHTINFEPLGLSGQCRINESLMACALRLGVGIISLCGGQGNCHSCQVQVLSGTVSEPTPDELEAFSSQQLKEGWRLACQTYSTSDCKLSLPLNSLTTLQRVQVEGQQIAVRPEPAVTAYHVKLLTPSLADPQADADRLLKALNQQHQLHCNDVDISALRKLPPQLRSWNWQCQASVRSDEVIALGPWPSRQLGLAMDLGTTKIAGYLVDLSDGRTLAAKGVVNPQISYGEDIISRISYAIKSLNKRLRLQKLVMEALNQLATDLCAEIGAETEEIVEAVVVGNTAMHHLLLGLPVRQLALSPYVPAVSRALDIKACNLGLHIAPGAYLYLLPNIAGFVGADHTAVLLATVDAESKGMVLALDIGTNTEVSLIDNGKIATTSCASGPAFEGWHIKDGMRATSGAIERVQIANDSIQYQTIDGALAIGICGSGILDAMAQLYLAGVLDKGGKMAQNHPRVRSDDKQLVFVLVSEEEREGRRAIVITQQDVRELQLAKAAIRTGIQVLLEAHGHGEEEIHKVIIAGAFGSYIDVANAIAIGMLPSLPLDRFRQVGNAAGAGARLALISLSKRSDTQNIASGVRYIELASVPNFNQTFVQASYLGRYRLTQGKRQEID